MSLFTTDTSSTIISARFCCWALPHSGSHSKLHSFPGYSVNELQQYSQVRYTRLQNLEASQHCASLSVSGGAMGSNFTFTQEGIPQHPSNHWTRKTFTEVKSHKFSWVVFISHSLACSCLITNVPKVLATSCSFDPIILISAMYRASVMSCGKGRWLRSVPTILWHRAGALVSELDSKAVSDFASWKQTSSVGLYYQV